METTNVWRNGVGVGEVLKSSLIVDEAPERVVAIEAQERQRRLDASKARALPNCLCIECRHEAARGSFPSPRPAVFAGFTP